MKPAAPPEHWTPKSEDPEGHYQRIFDFEKNHFSAKTIYNVFWSTNNYSMPEPIPAVDTEIEYWYGEEEKKARKNDIIGDDCGFDARKYFLRRLHKKTRPIFTREARGFQHA